MSQPFIRFDFFSPIDVENAATSLLDSLPNARRVPGDCMERYLARQKEISQEINASDRAKRAFVGSAERIAKRNAPGIDIEWSINGVEVRIVVIRTFVYISFSSKPPSQVVEELVRMVAPFGSAEVLDQTG